MKALLGVLDTTWPQPYGRPGDPDYRPGVGSRVAVIEVWHDTGLSRMRFVDASGHLHDTPNAASVRIQGGLPDDWSTLVLW